MEVASAVLIKASHPRVVVNQEEDISLPFFFVLAQPLDSRSAAHACSNCLNFNLQRRRRAAIPHKKNKIAALYLNKKALNG